MWSNLRGFGRSVCGFERYDDGEGRKVPGRAAWRCERAAGGDG
jgi:hypothetical protein